MERAQFEAAFWRWVGSVLPWLGAEIVAIDGKNKAYDTSDFIAVARELNVTPHENKNGRAATSTAEPPGTPVMRSA